jgi:hypothetical protein
MKRVKLFEQFINEKLDAKAMAQKVMKELDTFAQLHPQYQPEEVLSTIEGVLKKYKSLYGGKLIQKVGAEIRAELGETGNLANDTYSHIKDIDHIIMGALDESYTENDINMSYDFYRTIESSEDIKLTKLQKLSVNEGLRRDLKKYIKKNQNELDTMADRDDWDGIYRMLMNDFDVEDGSEDAEDLIQTFNFVY